MSDRLDLTPEFSVSARGLLSQKALATWEPDLWREPRLLVPVDVQALVVTAATREQWADVARRLPEGPEPDEGSPQQAGALAAPAPFTALADRPPGVYLHWALPDGLATGTVTHAPGQAAAPQLGLPPVPNRWLVARIGGGVPRRVAAWVVEADRGDTVPLAAWREQANARAGARTPWLEASKLTAVTGGDPAWAAVLDGVVDRFAVHDDLAGLHAADAGGTVTYSVCGWYSDAALDPLAGAGGRGGFEALIERLRWSVDPAALRRARAAAAEARAAATAARKRTPPRAGAGDVVASVTVGAVDARLALPTGVSKGLVEKGAVAVAPAPWSPRQSLCHGLVHGVRPDGRGDDTRPDPTAVSAALGSSSEEAFAALVGTSLPDPRAGERLTAAFMRGMAGRYDDPDGAVAVDEDLHGAEFISLPGGERAVGDRVRTSAPADAVLGALAGRATREEEGDDPPRGTKATVKHGMRVMEAFDKRHRGGGRGGPAQAEPTFRDVAVGLPRRHAPADPVLTLSGAGRSLRHGNDGRHTPDGLLACRLTGEPIKGLHGIVRARDLVAPLDHGGIPPECDALLEEAALTDPFHDEETADRAVERTGGNRGAVLARVRGELALAGAASQGKDVVWAGAGSTLDGKLASPVATTWWRQPWVPLYVEWELALDLPDADAAALAAWRLAEVDLEPDPDAAGAGAATTLTLTARSLLTPGPARTFAARVATALESEAARPGGGELEPSTEAALRTLAARASGLDITAAALDGLRTWLLGWDDNVARARGDGSAAAPLPARLPRLLRSGRFQLRRARVVDAFGRTLDLGPAFPGLRVTTSLTADGDGATGPAGEFVPRLTLPGRLMLRLVDPGREADEARVDQETGSVSPVAGWLLPDPVDHAVEVFEPAGEPIGQLLHDPDGPGVLWESAPGRPGPLGAPPPVNGPADVPLAGIVTGLLRADADRRAGGPASRQLTEDLLEEEESPLSALLRVLDTTAGTVDASAGGTEHLAGLVGRPLALVRALLRVEAGPDPAPPETPEPLKTERAAAVRDVARLAIPVRLGALTRQDDGLLGFFAGDDYSTFHPVAGEVLAAALDTGPRRGALATSGSPTDATARPVTSTYVATDPVLHVHPGQTVRLTLVVVPGTAVHATCGVLPRTAVRMQREWTVAALERIAPSLRIGPVLVDPATIRMPAPGGGGVTPSWAHRDTPTTWRDDPIAAASAEARLAESPAQVQEGWIRLEIAQEDE